MTRIFIGSLALSSLLTFPPLSWARTPATETTQPDLNVTIRLYDYAQVDGKALARAKEVTARIFRQSSVETVWLDCPIEKVEVPSNSICSGRHSPTDLVLRILPRSMASRLPHDDDSFGFAQLTRGDGFAFIASVFFHRVEELASNGLWRTALGMDPRQLPADLYAPIILGQLMAHEIGHLLLGTGSHSRGGVMRASWNPKTVLRAATGSLTFNRRQAQTLRANVVTRMQQQQDLYTAQLATSD